MRSRRSWWFVYGTCAVVVGLVLAWVTVTVLSLERAEVRARTEAAHQEALRLALWRMDSWLAPLLAREAGRPYFDYQAFYPPQRAYTTRLRPIEPGEILTPSPLLSEQSEYLPLHFQVGPDGSLSSPQAPAGSFREIARQGYLSDEQIMSNAAVLDENRGLLNRPNLEQCVSAAEAPAPAVVEIVPPPVTTNVNERMGQKLRTKQEAARRKGTYEQSVEQAGQVAKQVVGEPARRNVPVEVGSLVAFWSNVDRGARLVFAREVRVGDQAYYQGFLSDWPKLRGELLAQIGDLFAEARLVPVVAAPDDDESGTMLATIPVALEVPAPAVVAMGMLSPARFTLILTWLAVLAALVAAAFTLRASVAFGERRARFASAVTHELRTPLTTFRMYSEMLAEGMVGDAEKRQVYLETLRDESGRLSNLVENVLAYARLEEGRAPAQPAPTTVGELLDHVVDHLRQRAEAAGMALSVESDAPEATPLVVDTEVVGQILGNLVDNACKYAAGAADGTVHLTGRVEEGAVALRVRDHGRGVQAEHAKAIFQPFDRGASREGDATPGVGLGLALARGLARDLGGELVLESSSLDGACFKLTLPVSATRKSG